MTGNSLFNDSNRGVVNRHIWLIWLLFLLFFGGFITNVFFSLSVNVGQILFDLSLIFVFVMGICNLKRGRSYVLYCFNVACLFFVIGCLCVSFFTQGTVREALLGFRNNVIYLLVGVVIANMSICFDLRRILRFISVCAIILCLFAILQFVFRNVLPEQLMTLKGEQPFGFANTDIIRVNGLTGSTLGFSGLCVFLFAIISSLLCMPGKKSVIDVIALLLTICANLLTFSRASIVAMMVLAMIFVGRFLWKHFIKFLFVITVLGCSILSFVDWTDFEELLLVRRLTDAEETTSGSDDLHREMLENGLLVWSENKLTGVGIGTQGHSANVETCIVADGYWVATLLELGLPVFITLCGVYGLAVVYLFTVYMRSEAGSIGRMLSFGMLLTIGYFFLCSAINSTFSARHNFCLFWLLWGCNAACFENMAAVADRKETV